MTIATMSTSYFAPEKTLREDLAIMVSAFTQQIAGYSTYDSEPATKLDDISQLVKTGNYSQWSEDHWSTIATALTIVDDNEGSDVQSIADIAQRAKQDLGLPNKDVAAILDISRQTLHTYMKGTEPGKNVNAAVLERSKRLEILLDKIIPFFELSPASATKTHMINGETLFDLLKNSRSNTKDVVVFAEQLAVKINNRPKANSHNDLTLRSLTRTL